MFLDSKDRIIVTLDDKLTWSAEQQAVNYTVIQLDKKLQKTLPVSIKTDIENVMVSSFKTGNICGMVKGTSSLIQLLFLPRIMII